MHIIKSFFIAGFFFLMIFSLLIANIIQKKRQGKSVKGKLDLKSIPRSIIWLPALALLAMLFIFVHTIWYIIYPQVIDYLFPIRIMMNTPLNIAGMVLVAVGLIIMHTSQIQLGASYSILLKEDKQKLVTSGLFKIMRNPLYFGANLGFIGIFLMVPSRSFVVSMLILLLNNHFRILEEEKHLLKVYQDEYMEYKKRVGRYFISF